MQYDQRAGRRLQWDQFNIREWTVIEFLKLGTTVGGTSEAPLQAGFVATGHGPQAAIFDGRILHRKPSDW